MMLVVWVLAGVVGVSLGLLGAGGSILTVPMFTYLLGYPPKQAVAMSLPVVGLAAGAGAVSAVGRRTVRALPAGVAGASAVAGSFAGARLATRLDGRTQLMLLAAAMLVAAGAFLIRSVRAADRQAARNRHLVVLSAVGLGVGVLTGLLGIGGGFLIVPALAMAGGLSMHEARSASLLIVALSAASAFVGYLDQIEIAWSVVVPFALVAAAGVVAGGQLARRVSQPRLQQAFAVALLVLAVYMLVRG